MSFRLVVLISSDLKLYLFRIISLKDKMIFTFQVQTQEIILQLSTIFITRL